MSHSFFTIAIKSNLTIKSEIQPKTFNFTFATKCHATNFEMVTLVFANANKRLTCVSISYAHSHTPCGFHFLVMHAYYLKQKFGNGKMQNIMK